MTSSRKLTFGLAFIEICIEGPFIVLSTNPNTRDFTSSGFVTGSFHDAQRVSLFLA